MDQSNYIEITNSSEYRKQSQEEKQEEYYMRMALNEAVKGIGWVNPNPLVGAVIVKNGHVIGKGYHRKYGELHAERNAIADCSESAEGADIYVTLEPCCHYGKTPPCTEAIIEAGIKRVFIGSMDPNPLVAGKGVRILKEHGIKVYTGILEDECVEINKVFFHFIQNKKPYVILKYAMTLDGKISTYAGLSKWITNDEARKNVHKDRHRYSAIMVGINTVLSDDPLLTARIDGMKTSNPVRVICDSTLRTPLDSNIVKTAGEVRTIIATVNENIEKQQLYIDKGCEIIVTKCRECEEHKKVDLNQLIIELGKLNIDSLIIEGGAEINYSVLEAGIADHVQAYIAPKIFGGKEAKSPVAGQGVYSPEQAFRLKNMSVVRLGEDILVEADVEI